MIKSLLYSSSNFSLRKTTGFLLFLLLTTVGLRAQVATNYTYAEFVNNPNTYTNLDSSLKTILIPGATPTAWVGTAYAPVNTSIGFNFVYNGTTYTDMWVSGNGYVTFGATPTALNISPISSTTGGTYTGAIAGYAANLQTSAIAYDATIQPFNPIVFLN